MPTTSHAALAVVLQSDTCWDYDECALGIDLCSAGKRTCVNTHASFECLDCDRGFENQSNVCVGECLWLVHVRGSV